MFGFPTGLGALLINKRRVTPAILRQKRYFGGGNVQLALINNNLVEFKRVEFHQHLEEGTLPYLDIVAVDVSIDKMSQLTLNLNFKLINSYLIGLSEYFEDQLTALTHSNGQRLVELYRSNSAANKHGPIFAFNLKTSKSKYISFVLVDKLAQSQRIHLRVGCFCNIGACQRHLPHLTDHTLCQNFRVHMHRCGDHIDLIDGEPTGAIRVSLGYCTIKSDLEHFLRFLRDNFAENEIGTDLKINLNQGKLILN